MRPSFAKATRIYFMGRDAVACDKPSLAYLLKDRYAEIIYCFDDGTGNAVYEQPYAPHLVKQLQGKVPRKGQLLNHMEIGRARRFLVELASTIYGLLQRYNHLRDEALDGHNAKVDELPLFSASVVKDDKSTSSGLFKT